MLKRLATMLWGNFESPEELKKFGYSAVIFRLMLVCKIALSGGRISSRNRL